jgi:hypothetical protein
MELTLGDLLIIEFALAQFLKGIDLSMMAGQQVAQIIGKLEYQISRITEQATKQTVPGLTPPAA